MSTQQDTPKPHTNQSALPDSLTAFIDSLFTPPRQPAPQLRTALALTVAVADTRSDTDTTLCHWEWLSGDGSDPTVNLTKACGGSGWSFRPVEVSR